MSAQRRIPRSAYSFDNPVFGDELQRRTWMESYVVAYEVALLAAISVATAMVWVGGRPLSWWSVAVIWIIALGNIAALAHLRSAGIPDLPWRDRMKFWSFRLRLVLLLAWFVGFLRARGAVGDGPLTDLSPSTVAGMIVGASVAIGLMALADRRTRRRAAAQLPEDDRFDD